ncbi:hypothetical protein L9F63_009124 [Diploptera punctata]|uniref:Lipocalin/cytosolic fatty-acid binding domain-containing protein n=1 Tax=Diploptera punctata TaxID=6984 RepID=A0AAD8E1P0_DIPPU|nr:hypothetical protein L9F63_009124 [Diploptera punctata]
MKCIFILLTCLVVYAQNTYADCRLDPPTLENFSKEFQGLWYLRATYPSVFDKFTAVFHVLTPKGNTYCGDTVLTPEESEKRELKLGTWELLGDNSEMNVTYPDPAYMSGLYQVSATDYENYMILQGCPPITGDQGIYMTYFRKQCPQPDVLGSAESALADLHVNSSLFVQDPTLNCTSI